MVKFDLVWSMDHGRKRKNYKKIRGVGYYKVAAQLKIIMDFVVVVVVLVWGAISNFILQRLPTFSHS